MYQNATKILDKIQICDDEKQLPYLYEVLNDSINALRNRGCGMPFDRWNAPNPSFTIGKIGYGQTIKVLIKRKNSKGEDVVWKIQYKTPGRGTWKAHYGFTFVMPVLSKEETFFAQPVGVDSFKITKGDNRKRFDFYPTAMFTWFPSKWENSALSAGLTAGLGYDLQKLSVFSGLSLSYHQNLSLSLGMAGYYQSKLNGQYKEGQILKEPLKQEQLYVNVFRFNPYFSFVFNFDKSPFTSIFK